MLLVSGFREGAPTFKMIPLSLDCPFGEVVYIPSAKVLLILHKHTVEGLHMVPRLDDNGDPVRAAKPRADGNPYKQERKTLNLPQDSYINDKEQIKAFVNMFATNADFDYAKFMVDPAIITPETPKIIMP